MKRKTIFFCQHCHHSISTADKVLLVEEESNRSFCSEDCIVEFFNPHIDYFEEQDMKVRQQLNIQMDEDADDLKNDKKSIESTIDDPDEVWVQANELGEIYYTHIKKIKNKPKRWMIIICFYFQDGPSFLLFQNTTTDEKLLDYYRSESELNGIDDSQKKIDELAKEKEELHLSPEVIESVELKKSTFLAHLLQNRSGEDIDYEKFPLYEENTVSTLEEPDEIFRYKDEVGDVLLTYIKSYRKNKKTFFYIVVCMKIEAPEEITDEVLVPIVSFPSQDTNLYLKYAQGERISGNIKN